MDDRRRFSAFVAQGCDPGPTIDHSLQFAREFLAEHRLDPRLQVKLAIVVEELVTNALRHGGAGQDLSLSLALSEELGSIRLEIEDDGVPFNPLTVPPITGPNPETGGGIGIAIIQAWSEDPAYARLKESNSLTLNLR